MATIDVNGVVVDLRTKDELIEIIGDMVEDYSNKLKSGRIRTNKGKRAEKATIGFFGSIKHYLEGGIEG
ncbi:hypothetical protein AB6735_18580 [Mucilaginibacter sp. RCC_168]|uniref:hypothetical protein n=1 Tax=Mucilaginibacter sp. RCC_168 TaxID=3239221 RepID=UPI003523631F